MRYKQLKRDLRRKGCHKLREGGGHEIWVNPATGGQSPVSRHDSQEVLTGTLKNINRLLFGSD